MLRVAAAVALLLLSGCLASAPAPLALAPAPSPDDGLVVTATRVEPLVHALDRSGRIAAHRCSDGGASSCHAGTAFAMEWESPTFDFGDPAALFWRVAVVADWSRNTNLHSMSLTVIATAPCGTGCLDEREVKTVEGSGTLPIDNLDVYLQPGETGIRLRLQAYGAMEATLVEGIDYRVHGKVSGFRPAAAPVVVG